MPAIFRPVTTISESLKDQDKYLHIHSTILIFYFQTGYIWRLRYDEGVQAGIEQGLEKGLEQGKQSEKIETIFRMIAKNAPIELIAEYTETSIQEIANLIEKK